MSVNRECFYCHEPGHLIAVCPVLRKKEQSKNKSPVGLIRGELVSNQHEHLTEELLEQEIDDDFQPFISQGFFHLTGSLGGTGADNYFERYWCEEFFGSAQCGTFLGLDILWFRHLGLGSWTV